MPLSSVRSNMKTSFIISKKKITLKYERKMPEKEVLKMKSFVTNKGDKLFREWMSLDKDDVCDSHLYESNIHPTIKFIHERNIQPANWVKLNINEVPSGGGLFPQSDYLIDEIDYKEVFPSTEESISPYTIASFDIECDSLHGDT